MVMRFKYGWTFSLKVHYTSVMSHRVNRIALLVIGFKTFYSLNILTFVKKTTWSNIIKETFPIVLTLKISRSEEFHFGDLFLRDSRNGLHAILLFLWHSEWFPRGTRIHKIWLILCEIRFNTCQIRLNQTSENSQTRKYSKFQFVL